MEKEKAPQQINKLCNELSDSVVFFDKTLKEWVKYTNVIIQGDANPLLLKNYMAEISEKLNTIEEPLQYLIFLKEHFKTIESSKFNEAVIKYISTGKKTTRVKAEMYAQEEVKKVSKLLSSIEELLTFFRNLQRKLHKTFEIVNTMNVAEGYIQKLERNR